MYPSNKVNSFKDSLSSSEWLRTGLNRRNGDANHRNTVLILSAHASVLPFYRKQIYPCTKRILHSMPPPNICCKTSLLVIKQTSNATSLLGSELSGDLGQNMQDNDRENESHSQKKHNQRINSQTLSLVCEQLQHVSRRTTGACGSCGQGHLVSVLRLLVSGISSLGGASQSTWGNCRRRLYVSYNFLSFCTRQTYHYCMGNRCSDRLLSTRR